MFHEGLGYERMLDRQDFDVVIGSKRTSGATNGGKVAISGGGKIGFLEYPGSSIVSVLKKYESWTWKL